MKKHYNISPVLWSIVWGQGLFVTFILLEYFLVASGISECGAVVDSCIRVLFGIIALLIIRKIHGDKFKSLFTSTIKASTWMWCLPFFLYLIVELLYIPAAEKITFAYVPLFLLSCVQQLATGFYEEAASKGIVMSGMLLKWNDSVIGRIGMVFLSGLLFGSVHILNVLFNNDIIHCLWNALYASAFGVFLAALYLQSNSLPLCMTLHAVCDIVIRIRGNFCENIQYGMLTDVIYVAQDILELGVFPVVAILICVKNSSSARNEAVRS